VATILLSSYVIRHPVGGVLSNNLQFLTGFRRLGHDVYLLEKAGYESSCFDPERRVSGDDCSAGARRIGELLDRHDLHGRWCFVSSDGAYHGMSRRQVEAVIGRADVFIDRGLHQSWDEEVAGVPIRVLMDPDPGFRQVKLANDLARGRPVPAYDAYYTYGQNIGTGRSTAPTAGVRWRHVFHPVDTSLYLPGPPPGRDAPCTTVMNWTPLEPVSHQGRTYGMKDVQFPRFEDLAMRVDVAMEIAVEGRRVPVEQLRRKGWSVVAALDVTATYDSYHRYLRRSLAEFSVVKDVYCGLGVGWFSDRSAAYLAQGRPVVVQDNGIAGHLPTGEGLFEVATIDAAVDAIQRVSAEPERHRRAARRIAEELLDTGVVLGRFLAELGVTGPTGSTATRGRARL
jgi:hypothetical protein